MKTASVKVRNKSPHRRAEKPASYQLREHGMREWFSIKGTPRQWITKLGFSIHSETARTIEVEERHGRVKYSIRREPCNPLRVNVKLPKIGSVWKSGRDKITVLRYEIVTRRERDGEIAGQIFRPDHFQSELLSTREVVPKLGSLWTFKHYDLRVRVVRILSDHRIEYRLEEGEETAKIDIANFLESFVCVLGKNK